MFQKKQKRPNICCANCRSLERTRIIGLFLEKYRLFRPGLKVLHLAPESGLAEKFQKTLGSGYRPVDLDTSRYRKIKNIESFDLCSQASELPANTYDLVVHSHVIPHLRCNYTAVLYHLNRSLKDDGLQICCIPVVPGYFEDSTRHSVQNDQTEAHWRKFGREDLNASLGMVFRLPPLYNLLDHFSEAALLGANIPSYCWKGYTPHTVLVLKKSNFLLA